MKEQKRPRMTENGLEPVAQYFVGTQLVAELDGKIVSVDLASKVPDFPYDDCTIAQQMKTGVDFGKVNTYNVSPLDTSEILERGISDAILETEFAMQKKQEVKQEVVNNQQTEVNNE